MLWRNKEFKLAEQDKNNNYFDYKTALAQKYNVNYVLIDNKYEIDIDLEKL